MMRPECCFKDCDRDPELLLLQITTAEDAGHPPILYCVYHTPLGLETLAKLMRDGSKESGTLLAPKKR